MTTRCPRWTTPNGPCPQDVLPSGEHVCNVASPTHAKCRCACGVETLRSFAEREVARHEARIGRASITVDETASVVVKSVRLLQPKPGDLVVFHVQGGLTDQEFHEFMQHLNGLTLRYPDVEFVAAERIDDITVVRPEKGNTDDES